MLLPELNSSAFGPNKVPIICSLALWPTNTVSLASQPARQTETMAKTEVTFFASHRVFKADSLTHSLLSVLVMFTIKRCVFNFLYVPLRVVLKNCLLLQTTLLCKKVALSVKRPACLPAYVRCTYFFGFCEVKCVLLGSIMCYL